MDMEIIDDEEEYFLDTFLDPIDVWKFRKQNPETRNKIAFKQFMIFLIETPISQVPRSRVSENILQIHIESEHFSPSVLMQKYHKDMPEEEKTSIGKAIPPYFDKSHEKNLVKYFFNDFMSVEHSISAIKDNFEQS